MLVRLLRDQITELRIDNYVYIDKTTNRHRFEVIGMILSVSKQLSHLIFGEYILDNMRDFNLPDRSCTSSTLTTLNIAVHSFGDCLYLLDGRLECLSTVIMKITGTVDSMSNRKNQVSTKSSQ